MAHKLSFIGFGGMAGWHYENIKNKIKDIEIKGVWDVRESQREKAKGLGLYVYQNLQELLNDKEIDLVTIATPNDVHKELAVSAMRSGKNVVCEKPVTLNAKEMEEIIAVQKETGKLFSVHQNRRWDRDFVCVKEAIRKGLIGKPYFIESRVLGSRAESMFGWRAHQKNGGGMVLDWGVHLLDQALQLIDSKVVSCEAHLQKIFGDEVDDNIKLILRFANGVSYIMEMATNCFINQPRWHISGTEGTLVIEDWAVNGKIVSKKQDADMLWAEDIVYTEAGPTRTMAPRPKETMEEIPLPAVKSDWTDFYRNIVDVLDGKAEQIVKNGEVLRVMRLIDCLFASDRQGHGIPCDI